MKDFKTPLVMEILRVKNNGPRPPLRSLKELAEEFDVTVPALRAFIRHHNGPMPVLKSGSGNTVHRNTWYDPVEMRAWWRGVNPKKSQS